MNALKYMNDKVGFYIYLTGEIVKKNASLQELKREEERLLMREINADTPVRERIIMLQEKLV